MNYYISLFDKETREKADRVPIEDVIYNQDDIEFTFPNGDTLPYKDFLLYRDDYELVFEFE